MQIGNFEEDYLQIHWEFDRTTFTKVGEG
jgi:hypothetical protein